MTTGGKLIELQGFVLTSHVHMMSLDNTLHRQSRLVDLFFLTLYPKIIDLSGHPLQVSCGVDAELLRRDFTAGN